MSNQPSSGCPMDGQTAFVASAFVSSDAEIVSFFDGVAFETPCRDVQSMINFHRARMPKDRGACREHVAGYNRQGRASYGWIATTLDGGYHMTRRIFSR